MITENNFPDLPTEELRYNSNTNNLYWLFQDFDRSEKVSPQ